MPYPKLLWGIISAGDICIINTNNVAQRQCTVRYPSGGNNVFNNYKTIKDATINIEDATEVLYYCNTGAHKGYWKIGWAYIPYYMLNQNGSLDQNSLGNLDGYGRADTLLEIVVENPHKEDIELIINDDYTMLEGKIPETLVSASMMGYTYRMYVIYTDSNGKQVIKYSNPIFA